MRYQAKCNHCGRGFKINAQGGQRVKIRCPYCRNNVTVWLPDSAMSGNKVNNRGNKMRIFRAALAVVVIGAAIGLGTWHLYQQRINEKVLHEKLRAAHRKAHRDSLMKVRMEQNVRKHEMEEREMRDKSIGNFLKSFYLDAILGGNNAYMYENNITESCRKKLRDSYSEDCETAECLNWKIFAPESDAVDFNSLRRNLSISHHLDDWYKVRLVQYGHTEYRYIKVLIIDGNVEIDDVK